MEHAHDKTLIFRGLKGPCLGERIGSHWSTNPFFGLFFTGDGRGDLFVTAVETRIADDAGWVTSWGGYANFKTLYFNEDPSGARLVLPEEMHQLKQFRAESAEVNAPRPKEYSDIAMQIFGESFGLVALKSALSDAVQSFD